MLTSFWALFTGDLRPRIRAVRPSAKSGHFLAGWGVNLFLFGDGRATSPEHLSGERLSSIVVHNTPGDGHGHADARRPAHGVHGRPRPRRGRGGHRRPP